MSRFNDLLNKKAVALKYDERQSAAPVVVASGMGHLAEKMVEIANETGVPVYEDNSLATVLSQLQLGSQVPEQLYQAIVDIYVYFLRFANKKNLSMESEPGAQERDGDADEAEKAQAEQQKEEADAAEPDA